MKLEHAPVRSQSGYTLIELMVSLVLSLFLAAGVVSIFLASRQSFRADENIARMQDQARFALRELSLDVGMAGYVAQPLSPSGVTLDGSLAVSDGCGPAGGPADWFVRLTNAAGDSDTLTGADNVTGGTASAAYGCIDADEVRPDTDVVAVKRVAGHVVPDADLEDSRIYLQANGSLGLLYLQPGVGSLPAPAENREYRPRIYYIRNFTRTEGDGIPSLCRKVLEVGNPAPVATDCIAAGIEDLQVEYGLDLDGDGAVNQYKSDPTAEELQNTTSARITIIARTLVADRTYTDSRTYSVGNAPDRTPGDNFHRRVYSTTVMVHNVRNLRRMAL